MSDWKVGDRVQRQELDGKFLLGEIVDVKTTQREKMTYIYGYKPNPAIETYIAEITVKWDENGEQEILSPYKVSKEDSEMERAFRLAINDATARMEEKLNAAHALLSEAVNISEETGIPLNASLSPLSQSYIPESMSDKWPDLDRNFILDVSEAYGEYDGWQHSEVC